MSASPRKESIDYFESPGYLSPARAQNSFSQHDQPQRPGYNSRPSMRRGSTASIASSIGGSLDTVSESTSRPINDLAQNAISTLLSPPIIRTGILPHNALPVSSTHRAPSARDIPPVTLTSIPHVESSAFHQYLSVIGPLYENYQRAKSASEEAPSIFTPKEAVNDEISGYFANRRRGSTASTSPSLSRVPSTNFATPSSPSSLRRPSSSGGLPRKNRQAPTPLSTIPKIYFEENFQLENPRTFDVVSEKSDVIPPPPYGSREDGSGANGSVKGPGTPSRKALHTNAILQEKLSWYMDTVEVHLISSIATASASFFAALGSLKELQSEASDSVARIQSLRAALNRLDTEMAMGGLEVLGMKRRRENLRKLGKAVDQVCHVIEEANKCEELVEQNALESASKKIDDLEALIAGEPSSEGKSTPWVDLRQLKALEGVSIGITNLRTRIAKGFESQFIEALLSDLRQHVENVPKRETLQRWASATMRVRGDHGRAKSGVPAYMRTNDQLRPSLVAALAGIGGQGQAVRAASAYRDAVLKEIKSLIRRHLPSSSDDDIETITSVSTRSGRRLNRQEKSSILSRNLRALDANDAEELLVNIYTAVGEAIRRLGVQVKVLLDVTSTMEEPKQPLAHPPRTSSLNAQTNGANPDSPSRRPPASPQAMQEDVMQVLDLSSLLGQAVDVVQNQITKVLKTRTEQTTRLSLQEFLRYFMLNRLFADECEAVSSRAGESLKEVVNSQVKEFLQLMSEGEKQHGRAVLDSDKWEAKDFGTAENVILNRLLDSMNTTPQTWMEFAKLWEDDGAKNANNEAEDAAAEKARSASIESQKFILVSSATCALTTLDRYCNLMAGIPSLTPEAVSKMLEFLKMFNSRFVQLILGAGAMQSAGLKNITTKHLALASQMCSFIIALIPYLREFARRQAPSMVGPSLPEFDKVKRLFQEHQNSLHEKLEEIMSQRCKTHANATRRVNWDAADSGGPASAAIESLAKETTTLAKVLGRHLPDMEVQMILAPIFAHYKGEWTRVFEETQVKTEAGKTRLVRDAEFLLARFTRVDARVGEELGSELCRIARSKDVSTSTVAPAAFSSASTTTPPTTAAGEQISASANNTATAATEGESEKATESVDGGGTEAAATAATGSEAATADLSARATKQHESKSSIEMLGAPSPSSKVTSTAAPAVAREGVEAEGDVEADPVAKEIEVETIVTREGTKAAAEKQSSGSDEQENTVGASSTPVKEAGGKDAGKEGKGEAGAAAAAAQRAE